jgi:F0F1-type ATP synthase assembly protein I
MRSAFGDAVLVIALLLSLIVCGVVFKYRTLSPVGQTFYLALAVACVVLSLPGNES